MTTRRRIAVVGASGFIGRAVVRALTARGHSVRAVRAPRLSKLSASEAIQRTHDGTLLDPELTVALQHSDAVVNAAGISESTSTDARSLIAANSATAAAVILATQAADVSRFVHVSSAAVQGRREILDASNEFAAFSDYSRSKVLGERLISSIARGDAIVYRPPGVHGATRTVTRRIKRLAESPLASVAAPGSSPSPQAHIDNVADAIAFLATTELSPPEVVNHPWEQLTTSEVLEYLGARKPIKVPFALARAILRSATIASRAIPALRPQARRLEVLWLGQSQSESWLTLAGWQMPFPKEQWASIRNETDGDVAENEHLNTKRGKSKRSYTFNAVNLRDDRRTSPQDRYWRVRRRLIGSRDKGIVFGVTVGSSAYHFLKGQLAWFADQGWSVTLISSPDRPSAATALRENVEFSAVRMARNVSPLRDAVALMSWTRTLLEIRPSVVAIGTPKAALLGGMSSWLLNIPRRVYVVRGLRLEGTTGIMRTVLWLMEWATMKTATDTVFVSESLYRTARQLGLDHKQPWLIGSGSSNGVDTAEIERQIHEVNSSEMRRDVGLDKGDFVIGFIGRVTKDKGIGTLIEAFRNPGIPTNARLLIIGEMDEPEWRDELRRLGDRAIVLPWSDRVWRYLAIIDVLSLPTSREGFPNVVLEAAAAGIPTVTTKATGAVDSVVDGETGYVLEIGDSVGLSAKIGDLANSPELAQKMGGAARERAVTEFTPESIWRGMQEIVDGNAAPSFARLANQSSLEYDRS